MTLALQPAVRYWFPLSGDVGSEYTTPIGADVKDSYNPNGPVNHNLVYGIGFVYNFNAAGFDVASAVAR